MYPVIHIGSGADLKYELTNRGVLFSRWIRPVRKLMENIEAGEVELLEVGDKIAYHVHKTRTQILAERPEGVRFLREFRTAKNGLQLPSSESVSVSGKIAVWRTPNPQTVLENIQEEFWQELNIAAVPFHEFEVRYEFKPGTPEPSPSWEGLLQIVDKYGFRWWMGNQYQRNQFSEESDYRTSVFRWVLPTEKVIQECKQSGIQLAA